MSVALLGIPWDENSSYLRGAAEAPARIRQVLHCGASNLCAEDGTDLARDDSLFDAGDVELGDELVASRELVTLSPVEAAGFFGGLWDSMQLWINELLEDDESA